MDPDYEQLSNDVDLISRMKQYRGAVEKITDVLKLVDNQELYDKLSNPDKIKYNLLMSFGMNTLFWMYLRSEGIDPSAHHVKGENERLKQAMSRWQKIKDKKTKMPRLNQAVAKRFVRSGLWTPGNNAQQTEESNNQEMEEDWDEPTPVAQEQSTSNSAQ